MRSRELSRIGPVTNPLNVMVEPVQALAIASRRLPAPESAFVDTVGLSTHCVLVSEKLRLPGLVVTVYCPAVPLAMNAGAVATPFWSVDTLTSVAFPGNVPPAFEDGAV